MFNLKKINIHYGYIIVACCCLMMGVNVGLTISCAGIFYGPVSADLGTTVGKLGIYISLLHLFSTLTLSIAGKLMDKYSARKILTGSSVLMGCCFLAMSHFTAVWQFYIVGAILGVTMAFLLYLSFPTLINRWFKTRIGFFIGVCSAASGIGGIVFNPFGAYMITHYGWRTTYFIFGIIVLAVVSPILGILLRDYPKDKGVSQYGESTDKTIQKTSEMTGVTYAQAIKMPAFYLMLIFAFLMISVSTLNLFLPHYATGLGFSLTQASLLASSVMLGVTVGKIILGIINDFSSKAGLWTTLLCGTLGLIMLINAEICIYTLVFGGFLFGWAYAAVTVETPLLVRSIFGSKDYAKIYSNIAIALAAGGTLTAGGWGILADYTSASMMLIFGIVFLFISGGIGFYALNVKNNLRIS